MTPGQMMKLFDSVQAKLASALVQTQQALDQLNQLHEEVAEARAKFVSSSPTQDYKPRREVDELK